MLASGIRRLLAMGHVQGSSSAMVRVPKLAVSSCFKQDVAHTLQADQSMCKPAKSMVIDNASPAHSKRMGRTWLM